MSFVDMIIKKRNGGELSKEEINTFVTGVTQKTIPDYQISAMLMAICINSLNSRETAELTLAMAHSGETMDLSEINGVTADKHSTGGVGDTTTLILAPLTASLGLKVMKMSGRGLGHTGGTIDKLESIPGFNVSLTKEAAAEQVNRIGAAVIAQTEELAPADKYLYALRDVTGTVESIPLIASSIMSKKLAAGAEVIVLDVKWGNGAFMKTFENAKKLAHTMIDIGKRAGRKTSALITPMDSPLGMYIGNSLEVIEAIEILKGKKECRLKNVAMELGANMLVSAGLEKDRDSALKKLEENIHNGKGLEKFKEIIQAQGGDPRVCDDYSLFGKSKAQYVLKAWDSGYIAHMDTENIGKSCVVLGVGRTVKDQPIDLKAGIIMEKELGDKTEKGDVICTLYGETEKMCKDAAQIIINSVNIQPSFTPDPLNSQIITLF